MNNAPLNQERKNLRVTSICLLIVLIPDVVNLIYNIMSGDLSTASYEGVANLALAKLGTVGIDFNLKHFGFTVGVIVNNNLNGVKNGHSSVG